MKRHTMWAMLGVAWAGLAASATAEPVPVEAGQQYAAGTEVSFPAIGLVFTVPPSWTGALAEGGDAFAMGSETEPGLLLVTAQPGSTRAALEASLAEAVALDESTVMVPDGAPTTEGDALESTFSVPGHPELRGLAHAFLTPRGTAIGLVSLGPAGRLEDFRTTLRALARSLTESPPRPAPPSGLADWSSALRGMALVYMETSQGQSLERKLSLCRSGEYHYSDEAGAASNDASGDTSYATASADSGRWRVAGSTLVLSSSDGTEARHLLERRGESTFVDGTPWLLVDRSTCP